MASVTCLQCNLKEEGTLKHFDVRCHLCTLLVNLQTVM